VFSLYALCTVVIVGSRDEARLHFAGDRVMMDPANALALALSDVFFLSEDARCD